MDLSSKEHKGPLFITNGTRTTAVKRGDLAQVALDQVSIVVNEIIIQRITTDLSRVRRSDKKEGGSS